MELFGSLGENLVCWQQPSYPVALVGWAIVWAAVVSVPPGHSSQENVIRMNMAHAVVAVMLSTATILTGCDSTFSTAASVSFFGVDTLVMLSNGRRQARLGQAVDSAGRGMDYAHHVIGAVFGTFLLFSQGTVCQSSCPAPNLYMYAQTNEISTPLYGAYRISKNPVIGALFALVFFLSRIVFNFMYLVPYSWGHCTKIGFLIIAAPYQSLQVMWMFLIVKKATSTRRRGAGPVTTGTVKAD